MRFKAFLDLVKIEDQVANALAFLTGYAFSMGFNVFGPLSLFALASCCFGLMAANAFNQCCDMEIDKVNKPSRPIPSGMITLRSAYIIVIFLYSASEFLAMLVNREFLILASVGLIISILYSLRPFRLRDKFIVSNLSIALGYGVLNFLLGWCVYKPTLLAPLPVIAFLTVFDFFANMSKDYRDAKGDAAFNSRTVPIVLGRNLAIKFQFSSLYLTFTLPIVLFALGEVGVSSLFLVPVGVVLCALSRMDLLIGEDAKCYMKMMFLYMLIRLVLILSLVF